MRIGLGTAQFGSDYGINNRHGTVAPDEVERILRRAAASGIRYLDTAQAYGRAEGVLGDVGAASSFRIVSKTLPLVKEVDRLSTLLETSFQRLRTDRLYAILLHHGSDLATDDGRAVWRLLQAARQSGRIEKIGVSVYSPQELAAVLTSVDIDIVQLPASILDQRFYRSGLFHDLTTREIEVHVRSVFLQGLLLMPAGARPAWADAPALRAFDRCCRERQIRPLVAALSLCYQLAGITAFIVGCETEAQLVEIVDAYREAEGISLPMDGFECADESIIVPYKWPKA